MDCANTTCGLDFQSVILGKQATQLPIKGCVAFSVQQKGNVPVLIGGQMRIGDDCNFRDFPNVLNMPYIENKTIEWLDSGVVNPNYAIEVVVLLVKPLPQTQNPTLQPNETAI